MRRGFTLVELVIVMVIIGIIAAIAIPQLGRSKRTINEAGVIACLKSLVVAQGTFKLHDPDGDDARDFASSLEELAQVGGMVDGSLAAGTKFGYAFAIASSTPLTSWHGTAVPVTPGASDSGVRRFFVDQTGVIRYNHSQTATSSDPSID